MISVRMFVRAGCIIGLCVWGIIGALHHEAFAVLHAINMLTHEVGRLLFSMFGRDTLTALGGGIGQLAVPIAVTVVLFVKRRRYGSAIPLFWLGQNLLEIATDLNNARALQLSLVGINTVGPEQGSAWSFLLSEWGWLQYDLAIARLAVIIGWLCLFASMSLGLYCLDEPVRKVGEDAHRRE